LATILDKLTVAWLLKFPAFLETDVLPPTYEHRRNAGDLRIGNKTFEVVQSFQYLGNTTSNINNNNNNKCIKKRIMVGSKAYYANRQLFNPLAYTAGYETG
jgi:hypothetical protein